MKSLITTETSNKEILKRKSNERNVGIFLFFIHKNKFGRNSESHVSVFIRPLFAISSINLPILIGRINECFQEGHECYLHKCCIQSIVSQFARWIHGFNWNDKMNVFPVSTVLRSIFFNEISGKIVNNKTRLKRDTVNSHTRIQLIIISFERRILL